MNFNLFKIDTWWKAVFILGLISCVGPLLFDIDLFERKHLFGFGLGMLSVGVSYWMASKIENQFIGNGILSIPVIKHNFVSIVLLVIGIICISLFGFLIVRSLL